MEPLNYTRRFTKELLKIEKTKIIACNPDINHETRNSISYLSKAFFKDVKEKFDNSVKFLFSQNIYEADIDYSFLYEQEKINLPFEKICLEFETSKPKQSITEMIKKLGEDCIGIDVLSWFNANVIFVQQLEDSICFIYAQGDNTGNWILYSPLYLDRNFFKDGKGEIKYVDDIYQKGELYDFVYKIYKNGNLEAISFENLNKEPFRRLQNSIDKILFYFFSFLKIISCSNVSIEKIKPKRKIKTRFKKNKIILPYDDYHVLKVGTPFKNTNGGQGNKISDRHSPREHLRRGHIRRLSNGKTIWVNSAIVNASAKNKVSKDYFVKTH